MKKSVLVIVIILFIVVSACKGKSTTPTAINVTATATFTPTPSITETPTITPTATIPPTPTLAPRPTLAETGLVSFSILHTNDFHGHIIPQENNPEWGPGAARLAYFIKNYRAQVGAENMLLLDAGDTIEGSNEAVPSKGQIVLDLYNKLGYQAGAIGNHEFYYAGEARLIEILQEPSSFQFLSANIYKQSSTLKCGIELLTEPYKIFDIGKEDGPKVRVAVIGIASKGFTAWGAGGTYTCFTEPVDAISNYYERLKNKEHADLIVVLSHNGYKSHNGYENDRMIAQRLIDAGTPVDIIIGGHSHTFLEKADIFGQTYVVQAGDFGRQIGVFDLTFDRATHALTVKWKPYNITLQSPKDPEIDEYIKSVLP